MDNTTRGEAVSDEIISQEDAHYYKNRFKQERQERERQLLVVKRCRDGSFGFEVSSTVSGLSLEEIKEYRAMIPVAIACSESMFGTAQEALMMANTASS